MRTAYVFTSRAIALLVLFQAAVIAFGVFDLAKTVEDDGSIDKSTAEDLVGLSLHGIGAMVLSVLVILLLIFSFFTKVPGAVRWALIVFGVTVLQWVFAIVAFSVPAIGLLHGLNAFAVAATAGIAGRVVSTGGATTPAAAEPAPAA
ncbi:hypothetical protein ACIB24_11755 [Spongisporangium articulatum]|uniref:Uncharacterized protein n=1 Tax=Spongisporangium articulatum TaxID=3362603 RepID=A0ABW8AMY2_9ACTN